MYGKTRQTKILAIAALILAFVSVSLGFAAFSSSLQLSSSANVSPDNSTFSVKFSTNKEKLVIDEVEPSDISNDITEWIHRQFNTTENN